jgi:hypothetical protein
VAVPWQRQRLFLLAILFPSLSNLLECSHFNPSLAHGKAKQFSVVLRNGTRLRSLGVR